MSEVDPTDPPIEDDDPANPPIEDEYVPPSQEDHAKMVKALAARKKEAADAKRELAALKAAGKAEADKAPPVDPDLKVKRQGALAALTGAGLTKDQAKKAVRLMDLDSVEVDEDGDVDLDEALADLKTAFPGLFPAGKRAPRVDQADKGGAGSAAVDKTTQRLLAQAGYTK